jgi:hypothetical protein
MEKAAADLLDTSILFPNFPNSQIPFLAAAAPFPGAPSLAGEKQGKPPVLR